MSSKVDLETQATFTRNTVSGPGKRCTTLPLQAKTEASDEGAMTPPAIAREELHLTQSSIPFGTGRTLTFRRDETPLSTNFFVTNSQLVVDETPRRTGGGQERLNKSSMTN